MSGAYFAARFACSREGHPRPRKDRCKDGRERARSSHSNIEIAALERSQAAQIPAFAADGVRFSALITGLAELYRDHIAVEEREVFPVAVAVLGKPQRDAMGGEMAARRGLRQSL
jgi:hypothetical protein